MSKENTDRKRECFTADRLESIAIIHFKEHMLFHATGLRARDSIMAYLDRVSEDDSIKVVLIISSYKNRDQKDYFDFYSQIMKSKYDLGPFYRLCNVIDQFILKIVGLDKFVINVSSGDVISLFLNVSLACDYRVIADNTIFHNPYLDLGLLPKGGGPFFLSRMLDSWKAYKVLLLRRLITAEEALELAFVDKVVPIAELEQTAIEVAEDFRKIPLSIISGIKRLKNYSIHDLRDYLELENEELRKTIFERQHSV
jgi:enoyl-CoA hydratase/carnithine racemase